MQVCPLTNTYENSISERFMNIHQYETVQGLHFYKKKHILIQFKKPYKKPHSSLLKQKTKTNLIAQ